MEDNFWSQYPDQIAKEGEVQQVVKGQIADKYQY